jgi:hypothetical protein
MSSPKSCVRARDIVVPRLRARSDIDGLGLRDELTGNGYDGWILRSDKIKRGTAVAIMLWVLAWAPAWVRGQEDSPTQILYEDTSYDLYPTTYSERPQLPSPLLTDTGEEVVICATHDERYTLIPVTPENGAPLNYKYGQWWGKGQQLGVDSTDFPALARSGRHAEWGLRHTRTITGRPIDEITRAGHPDGISEQGFIAQDEDILSVLKGDNRLVQRLKLRHPALAGPLLRVFNIILAIRQDSESGNIKGVLYNDRRVDLKFWGMSGWQESIFADEILGSWEIEISRALDEEESSYLAWKYGQFGPEHLAELTRRLTSIRTTEMIPYYIMRYGFYAGHTPCRADPIAVAFIFTLRSLEEIEHAFQGELLTALTDHHVKPDRSNRK